MDLLGTNTSELCLILLVSGARVERVSQAVAQEREGESEQSYADSGQPHKVRGRVYVGISVLHHGSPGWARGPHTDADEAEDRLGNDKAWYSERRRYYYGRETIRQEVRHQDPPGGHPNRAGRLHELFLLQGEHLT